ncbi:MAG: glycosyltransferase [bacterium]|nr:glycosyltransferase [bacterium]
MILPQRVAIFLPSLGGGGAERVMMNLAGGLIDTGVQADLVIANASGPYRDQVPPEVRVFDLGAARVMAGLPGLVGYLRRERPTLLLTAVENANLTGALAGMLAGTPVFFTVHIDYVSFLQNQPGWKNRTVMTLMRFAVPLAKAVIAVSQGAASGFIRITGAPPRKVHAICNPLVTPDLLARAQQPLETGGFHGWFAPGEPPVVLGVGRLTAQKDFATLLRAFAHLRQQRPARLVILGEGEDRPMLEALARELGIEADVALPGFVQNPHACMGRAGVLAMSSRFEGFGNVLVEAMACGCPVVSTDCPSGPAEILEHGSYGALVPVGDFIALGGALAQTLDHPPDRAMLRQRADEFTVSKVTQRYLQVFAASLNAQS